MIHEWRRQIDEIDDQVLQLLKRRAECALAIGEAKARQHLPIRCPEREQEMTRRLVAQPHGPLDDAAVRRVFGAILAESRRLEAAVTLANQKCPSPYRRVAIVGVGLMGGSLGLAIKRCYQGVEVIGVDCEEAALHLAQERGAIDHGLPLAQGVAETDLICLAAPVKAIVKLIEDFSGMINPATMVTDLGSTKAEICAAAHRFLPDNFVGGHPLTGSERQGIGAADVELFRGAVWALTPLREANERVAKLKEFIEGLGACALYLPPEEHDRVVAYVSHLPQLLAVALAELVAERGSTDEHYQALAAGGFSDMTRIAASPYAIWQDIFASNAQEVDGALATYIDRLSSLRQTLSKRGSLRDNFARTGAFRRYLRRSSRQKENEDGTNHSPR